jgi:exodeoxyribonuclease III
VRIATFNINGVNRRLDHLLGWLAATEPDIVCLQELKVAEPDFPRAAIEAAGYGAVWRSESAWNGVAILARDADPLLVRTDLPGDPSDRQRRYIEAAVRGILVASIYAPNGNPQPGPKFDYKLAWLERLRLHAGDLFSSGVPVVLAGDYNVAPGPEDVYPTSSYDNDALVQPRSRAAFRQLIDQGWVDAVRRGHPSGPVYTFWDYRRKRWERDAGLRLDHLLLGGVMVTRLMHAGVDRSERSKDGASDHAPVWIEVSS